jgi:hypothetical protein
MPAPAISSLERRVLKSVGEELAGVPVVQWTERSLRLCLALLRDLHETAAGMREALEGILAEGVEARGFAREYAPLLPVIEEQTRQAEELLQRVSPAKDASTEAVEAGLRRIVEEYQAYRDLLADALSRASQPPRPVNWERVRTAEEAHARGESKRYSPQK